MIRRQDKFPLRTEFLRFRARSKKIVTPLCTMYYVPRTSRASRLAVVVPKKVNKLATTRNYLKRLAYDSLWSQIKDQKVDVIVVFKPLPLKKSTATKQQIISELSSALSDITNPKY